MIPIFTFDTTSVYSMTTTNHDLESAFTNIKNDLFLDSSDFPSTTSLDQSISKYKKTTFGDFLMTKKNNVVTFQGSCVFIIQGSCGLIGNDKDFYIAKLEGYNTYFSKHNINILLMRGNEDNPRYFTEDFIELSNIRTIPDYSVITTPKFNILCVGGGLSIDRLWKINKKDNNYPYFGDTELPLLQEDLLNEIAEKYTIDAIVTHLCPSFATDKIKGINSPWTQEDKSLLQDIINASIIMDNIYLILFKKNKLPKLWLSPSLSNTGTTYINGIEFKQNQYTTYCLTSDGNCETISYPKPDFSLSVAELEPRDIPIREMPFDNFHLNMGDRGMVVMEDENVDDR